MAHPSDEERTGLLGQARALLASGDPHGVVGALAGLAHVELITEPELGYLLANALRRTGDAERATTVVEALAGPCERRGRDRLWRERLNLEAALAFDAGALDVAHTGWSQLVDTATRANDSELLRRAHNNLGVVHTLLGEWDAALTHYGRALAVARRLGDVRGMAEAHQNLGMAYRELDFVVDADSHFRSAIELGRSSGYDDIVGRAEEERALACLFAGDTARALALAARALERFRHAREPLGEAEAERVLGIIALSEGRLDDALSHLNRALGTAQSLGAVLLEAETLEALAALASLNHDDAAAGESAARSDGLFEAMNASAWGRQIRLRMREVAGPG
ncbi:MAG: tetratricopeptide repeat protein [Gemmatimonadetes bacterium]|nr:tetratricopeptide repeat protein [Gemmatimonadota bacterium]